MSNSLVRVKCGICGKVAKEARREMLHRTIPTDYEYSDEEIFEILKVTPERVVNQEYTCYVDEIYAVIIHLECGHMLERPIERADETVEIISQDGRTPFDFQWETCTFIEAAGLEGLILHEQGLGKTVCAAMLIKRNEKHMCPLLYVCPATVMHQTFGEMVRWTGIIPQMITRSSDIPDPAWGITLVSVDMLRLVRPDIANNEDDMLPDSRLTQRQKIQREKRKNPKWTDELLGQYKTIIMDESQKIKNDGSSRTQAFRKIIKLGNYGNKAKVICLSGTNIEKHAGEYFVTLNAVRPELFPFKSEFEYKWVQTNDNGKMGPLKNPKKFKELTQDFIIRYRREEVLPNLPKVFRQMRLVELEDNDALKGYLKVLGEFTEFMMNDERRKTPQDILGYMQRLRHWTGVAKVPEAVEFVEEFLMETDDDRKLVVFTHHKDAAAQLMTRVSETCKTMGYGEPLFLNAALNLKARDNMVQEFKKPQNRIMIASELIAGVGLNLQFCSDCVFLERQFNPSHEEQAEGRFPRPGRGAEMPNKINAVYIIAAGTIDEWLTKLIEEKRRNVRATLDYETVSWDETTLMRELSQVLFDKGRSHWQL